MDTFLIAACFLIYYSSCGFWIVHCLRRRERTFEMGYRPISDYGLIGNMFSAALVGLNGSINWCCLPRFDSPSVFADILDDQKGGRLQIRPKLSFESRKRISPR